MSDGFTDSLEGNVALLNDIISGAPAGAQQRAKATALQFERLFNAIKADSPKDPAVAFGAAWALHMLALRLAGQFSECMNKTGDDARLVLLQ